MQGCLDGLRECVGAFYATEQFTNSLVASRFFAFFVKKRLKRKRISGSFTTRPYVGLAPRLQRADRQRLVICVTAQLSGRVVVWKTLQYLVWWCKIKSAHRGAWYQSRKETTAGASRSY